MFVLDEADVMIATQGHQVCALYFYLKVKFYVISMGLTDKGSLKSINVVIFI